MMSNHVIYIACSRPINQYQFHPSNSAKTSATFDLQKDHCDVYSGPFFGLFKRCFAMDIFAVKVKMFPIFFLKIV
jgi:hypothetical protein